jgi:hypothetical protein
MTTAIKFRIFKILVLSLAAEIVSHMHIWLGRWCVCGHRRPHLSVPSLPW